MSLCLGTWSPAFKREGPPNCPPWLQRLGPTKQKVSISAYLTAQHTGHDAPVALRKLSCLVTNSQSANCIGKPARIHLIPFI